MTTIINNITDGNKYLYKIKFYFKGSRFLWKRKMYQMR